MFSFKEDKLNFRFIFTVTLSLLEQQKLAPLLFYSVYRQIILLCLTPDKGELLGGKGLTGPTCMYLPISSLLCKNFLSFSIAGDRVMR